MKIAIPLTNGELSPHFGHCEAFAVFTVENSQVTKKEVFTPCEQGCGAYPKQLKEQGCSVILAGGMGQKAKENLIEQGIEVVHGLCEAPLDTIVKQYLEGTLDSEGDLCNHEHSADHDGHCGEHHKHD
jgi:predicted Fe-Mo cluster-binding NifX family protein